MTAARAARPGGAAPVACQVVGCPHKECHQRCSGSRSRRLPRGRVSSSLPDSCSCDAFASAARGKLPFAPVACQRARPRRQRGPHTSPTSTPCASKRTGPAGHARTTAGRSPRSGRMASRKREVTRLESPVCYEAMQPATADAVGPSAPHRRMQASADPTHGPTQVSTSAGEAADEATLAADEATLARSPPTRPLSSPPTRPLSSPVETSESMQATVCSTKRRRSFFPRLELRAFTHDAPVHAARSRSRRHSRRGAGRALALDATAVAGQAAPSLSKQ